MTGQCQSYIQRAGDSGGYELVRHNVHRGLSWAARSSYFFAEEIVSVNLALSETLQVASEFPIVFSLVGGEVVPTIRFSGGNCSNGHVGSDGAWLAHYLPAGLKAYPFSIGLVDEASNAGGIAKEGVCWRVNGVDSAFALLVASEALCDNDAKDSRAFYAQDRLSESVRKVAAFAKALSEDMAKAKLIAKALWDFGFLVPLDLDIGDEDDQPYRVDERRVKELPRMHAESLRNAGGLPLIYGHLVSMEHLTYPTPHSIRLKRQGDSLHDTSRKPERNSDDMIAFRRAVINDLRVQ